MNTVFMYLGRNLPRMPWRLIGVCLTIAGGGGFFAGVRLALESIPRTLSAFYDETSFADLEVQIVPEDIENLPDLRDLPGVQGVESRLIFPSIIQLPNGKPLAGALHLSRSPTPAINRFRLIEGFADWNRAGTVVIDQGLAKYHGYKVGDVVRSKVGEKIYHDTVTGIAVSPEFFSTAANPELGLAEKGTFGVVFGGLERLRSSLGFALANDLVFKLSGPEALAKLKPALLKRLEGVGVQKLVPRERHFSHQNLAILLKSYAIHTTSIILTLLILSMSVAYVAFARFVAEQRQEIGTLLALGHPPSSILAQTAVFGAGLGLASAAAGWIMALILGNLFTRGFMEAYGLPFVDFHADPATAAVMTLICIGIGTAGMAIPAWRLLRLSPLRVMRPPVQEGGGEGKVLGLLAGMGSPLPTPIRHAIRNLVRNRAMTGLYVLIVGFAIGVPISFSISSTSSLNTLLGNFEGEKWDLSVDFLHPVFQEDADTLLAGAGASIVSPFFGCFGEIVGPAGSVDARLLGISRDKGLRQPRISRGRDAAPGGSEILIGGDLAGRLGCVPGDTVRIRAGWGDEPFLVAGFTSDSYPRHVLMDLAAARNLAGFEGKITGAYLAGPALDGAALASRAEVGRLIDRRNMLSLLLGRWEDALFIVHVTTVFSLSMAFIFIVTTLGLSIQEQRGEYALMLALGFRGRDMVKILFTEAWAQMALASLLSVAIGMLMAVRFNAELGEAWFQTSYHSRPSDYLWPVAGALALLPWVVGLGAWSVLRSDLGKHLRNRDIG